jgi:putative colanic acid biosynthesis UDP-glucose lipid carrier transferase
MAFVLLISDVGLAFLSVYVFLDPVIQTNLWHSWTSFQNDLYISIQLWIIASLYYKTYRDFASQGLEGLYRKSWRVLITQQIFFNLYVILNSAIFYQRELLYNTLFSFTFLSVGILFSRVFVSLIWIYREKNSKSMPTVAIWGFNQTGIELASRFDLNPGERKFVGILDENLLFDYKPINELKSNLLEAIQYAAKHKIHELYICIAPQKLSDVKSLFKLADEKCLRIRFVPDIAGNFPDNAVLQNIYHYPAISQRNEPLEDQNNRFIKRMFDVFFSVLVLVFIMSWLYPLLGLLIKIQSPGPIIFKQLRSGENNEPFLCYKFRSMRVNKDSDLNQMTKGDSRVTKIGHFIRKTSIDELPQFLNVLKGEMSVVGPRPHMLNHTKQYNELTENFMVRHFVKPGITGLAQIRGLRGEITDMKYMQERINVDIEYLENWDIISDIKICFLTFYSIIKGDEKAY